MRNQKCLGGGAKIMTKLDKQMLKLQILYKN